MDFLKALKLALVVAKSELKGANDTLDETSNLTATLAT